MKNHGPNKKRKTNNLNLQELALNLQELPIEIIFKITDYLDTPDLKYLSETSSFFYSHSKKQLIKLHIAVVEKIYNLVMGNNIPDLLCPYHEENNDSSRFNYSIYDRWVIEITRNFNVDLITKILLEMLNKKNVAINDQQNELKITFGHLFAAIGNSAAIKALISAGADFNLKDSINETPASLLFLPCKDDEIPSLELLQFLKDNNVDFNFSAHDQMFHFTFQDWGCIPPDMITYINKAIEVSAWLFVNRVYDRQLEDYEWKTFSSFIKEYYSFLCRTATPSQQISHINPLKQKFYVLKENFEQQIQQKNSIQVEKSEVSDEVKSLSFNR